MERTIVVYCEASASRIICKDNVSDTPLWRIDDSVTYGAFMPHSSC